MGQSLTEVASDRGGLSLEWPPTVAIRYTNLCGICFICYKCIFVQHRLWEAFWFLNFQVAVTGVVSHSVWSLIKVVSQ